MTQLKKKVSTEFWYTHGHGSWWVCVCVFFKDDLESGEEVATCPSCSLIVRVIYDKVRILVLNLSSRLPSGLLTVCVLLLRRPLCVESLWKLQLLLLERNWSRFSPENVSCSLVFHPPDALQKSWGDKWTDEFVNVVNVSGDAVRFYSLLTTDIGLFFHYVFLGIINQFQNNQNQPRGGAIQPIFTRFDDASFFCIGPRDDSSSGFAGPDPQVLQAQRSWRTFHIRVFPCWIIKADVDRLG